MHTFSLSSPLLSLHTSNDCWSSGIPFDTTEITIPDNSCNDDGVGLDLGPYTQLKKLTIGRNCFSKVGSLVISHHLTLESISIGVNSFIGGANDTRSRFSLHDCDRVRELRIGRYAFPNTRLCSVHSNRRLETVVIGDVNEESSNFIRGSLSMYSGSVEKN